MKKHGVCVVVLDQNGFTYLVGQYRFAAGHYSWEIPAGSGEGEEEPLAVGQRELREETGLVARQWLQILKLHPSPALTDESVTCFLAWDLEQGTPERDDTEVLQVRRIRFSEAIGMIDSGEITHAAVVSALFRIQSMANADQLPAGLRIS